MNPTPEQLQTTLDTLRTLQDGIDTRSDCSACERFNLLVAAEHLVMDYAAAAEISEPPRADWSVGSGASTMAALLCPITGPRSFDIEKARAELAEAKAATVVREMEMNLVSEPTSIPCQLPAEPKTPQPEPAAIDEDGRKLDDAIGRAY